MTHKEPSSSGVVLVELAIVITLLAVIGAGIFDLGSVMEEYTTLVQAAREGARLASRQPDTSSADALKNAAIAGAQQVLLEARLDTASYKIGVRSIDLSLPAGTLPSPAIRVSVGRQGRLPGFFIPGFIPPPCAAVVMKIQSRLSPTPTVTGDNLC